MSKVKKMGGNMVSVKWLDTNKGDRLNPNYRSRWVAREVNQGKDDTLYAGVAGCSKSLYVFVIIFSILP